MSARKTIKVRIPVVVTADGKWGAWANHGESSPDWGGIEDGIGWGEELRCPRRYFIEAELEIPSDEAPVVTGTAMSA